MKRSIFIAAMGAVALLSSCQEGDQPIIATPSNSEHHMTLNVVAENNTRAADGITRYIIEAYADADYSQSIELLNDQSQLTTTDGSFEVILDRTKEYHILLWADVAGNEAFDTSDLTTIELKSGKQPVEAWGGKVDIAVGQTTEQLSVTLKRTVAKINLVEEGVITPKSSLSATFYVPSAYDTTKLCGRDIKERTETISLTAGVTADKSNPVVLNDFDIYIFASQEQQDIVDFTFQMTTDNVDANAPIKATNVPLQANHLTRIIGHYTSLATETFSPEIDDNWSPSEN